MHASSLQPMHDVCFYVSGNVTVHPDAAIAPGALLQADPGCHLILHARVSVGAGAVIHAHQGTLELEADATVGTQVLLIGHGTVGKDACIGAFSTLLFKIKVDDQEVIPSRSLIGDDSRGIDLPGPAEGAYPSRSVSSPVRPSSANGWVGERRVDPSVAGRGTPSTEGHPSPSESPPLPGEPNPPLHQASPSTSTANGSSSMGSPASNGASENGASNGLTPKAHVYGRRSVEQLIRVMFPAHPLALEQASKADEGSDANETSSAQP